MEGRNQRQTPHVFVILAVLLLLASALTWLVPAGTKAVLPICATTPAEVSVT